MTTAYRVRSFADCQHIAHEAVGSYIHTVTPAAQGSQFVKLLEENTERLQGSLVLLGYGLLGGDDHAMIQRAALAIELLHAYVQSMEKGIETEQALRGMHEAQIILANLETDEENRLKALSITNRTLMLAGLARLPETSPDDALTWRVTELVLNPLHVGQVLAGADCRATNAVTPASLAFGKARLEGKNPPLPHYIETIRAAVNGLPEKNL